MSEIFFAFLLDLWIGDPVYAWHPARVMGRIIEKAEPFLRSRLHSLKIAGAVLSLSLPFFTWGVMVLAISGLRRFHPALGWTVNLFGIYSALSIKDLYQEGLRIYQDLKNQDLPNAHKSLARIVGRDTEHLDESSVIRAGVETIAESSVDGIIAPLFFAVLGGAPLALAYKAVNTLDSMIGHKNERYLEFGFFAAKQDEVWNWIPARISYLIIGVSSFLIRGQTRAAFVSGWKDGIVPSSSYGNSVISEAAFAGSLGLQLGGPSTYQGEIKNKPLLGLLTKDFVPEDLMKSLNLMMTVSWVSLAMVLGTKYGVRCWV